MLGRTRSPKQMMYLLQIGQALAAQRPLKDALNLSLNSKGQTDTASGRPNLCDHRPR
jgi:hypothetical protein